MIISLLPHGLWLRSCLRAFGDPAQLPDSTAVPPLCLACSQALWLSHIGWRLVWPLQDSSTRNEGGLGLVIRS